MMSDEKHYKNFLDENLFPRVLKNIEFITSSDSVAHIYYQGRQLINFSSTDYLGLARHPLLIARSQEYAKHYGVGSTSSRLVSGNLAIYEQLEQQLAKAVGKPAALILGTGYQANISILEALLDPKILGAEPLVFSDRNCHVSLLSNTQHLAKLMRFQHNDLDHLQTLLEKYAASDQAKFILVESVYSMDGDQADLVRIASLAKQYQAMLYVDDAHAVGIYGATGWGLASDQAHDIDFVMGTFSKALGSHGAYIACSETMRHYLINKCRGLIYSTGLSPAVLGAMAGAIELMPRLAQERLSLLKKAKTVRQFFIEHGLDYGDSNTHIIPWIIGDAEKTLLISQLLEEQGILATAIRPPSVPYNKSRIRFCLSAAHSEADMNQLMQAVCFIGKKLNLFGSE